MRAGLGDLSSPLSEWPPQLKTGMVPRGPVCVLLWEKSARVLAAAMGPDLLEHRAQTGTGQVKWEGQLGWKSLLAPPSTTAPLQDGRPTEAIQRRGHQGWGEGWPQGGAGALGLGTGVGDTWRSGDPAGSFWRKWQQQGTCRQQLQELGLRVLAALVSPQKLSS